MDSLDAAAKFLLGRDDLSKQNCTGSDKLRLIMTPEQIKTCVEYVAGMLNSKFKLYEKPIVIVGLLKGAFIFMADLVKQLTFPYDVNFIRASSYHGQTQSEVKIDPVNSKDYEGKTVILVDELFDKGLTMHTVKQYLIGIGVDEVYTCVLFTKRTNATFPLPDFCGIKDLPSVWLIGYGLDDQGKKRGWPFLFGIPKPDDVPLTPDDAIFLDSCSYNKALCEIKDKVGK